MCLHGKFSVPNVLCLFRIGAYPGEKRISKCIRFRNVSISQKRTFECYRKCSL